MSSSCSAAPDPAVGAQVSVLRCHSQCDRGMASHHPTAHPSASQYSQSSRGFFPSHPLWQGWCFRIFLGSCTLRDSPPGPGHCSPVPPALFVSQLLSLELLGCPWTWPGQHWGLGKAGVGTGTASRDPRDRNSPWAVPLCQPSQEGHKEQGRDRLGASWHQLPHRALGFAPSRCCGWLQCQGSLSSVPGVGGRLWCQGGGG